MLFCIKQKKTFLKNTLYFMYWQWAQLKITKYATKKLLNVESKEFTQVFNASSKMKEINDDVVHSLAEIFSLYPKKHTHIDMYYVRTLCICILWQIYKQTIRIRRRLTKKECHIIIISVLLFSCFHSDLDRNMQYACLSANVHSQQSTRKYLNEVSSI